MAPAIVAEDPAMQRVMQLVDRVAPGPLPVLIEGEKLREVAGIEGHLRNEHAIGTGEQAGVQGRRAAVAPEELDDRDAFVAAGRCA